jgi:hypothetical protein
MSLRNDRRRRVLADDLLNPDSAEALPSGNEPLQIASGLRYAPAARRENQARLVDIVPQRALPFFLLFSVGVAFVAALLLGFAWLPNLSQLVSAEALAPLDLSLEHNLATWFMSLLLVGNMQLALMVYSVRKHRIDDYHGRYRIWLAMALASLIASINIGTGIDQLLRVALAPLARWCGVAEQYGLWAASGIVVLYLTVRLVLETRRSKLAISVLVLSAIAFVLPLVLDMGWLSFDTAAQGLLFKVGSRLAGCLLMLTGTALFARHVILDVEGKLREREPKTRKPAKAKKPRPEKTRTNEEPSTTTAQTMVDPSQKPKPHIVVRTDLETKPRPTLAPKPAPLAPKPVVNTREVEDDDERDDEDGSSTDLRNLSRTERKRLKREAKLTRRAEMAR